MISMALEIRNKGLYHNCGETIDTPNGKAKIVDINFDGCFYIVECEDGFKSPIAFDTVYRLNDAKDNICSRHKVYDPNCRLCNVTVMQTPDSKLEFHEQVKSQPVPGELEFQQHMEKQIAEQTAKKKLFQMLDMKDMPSWKKAVLYIMAGIMLVSMSASILLTLYNMIRGDSFATILVGVPILAFISFVIWHARNRTDDIDSSLRMAEELEKRKAK